MIRPAAAQEDTTTCIREFTDMEKRIGACTREINSRKWKGANLAMIHGARGLGWRAKNEMTAGRQEPYTYVSLPGRDNFLFVGP